MARFALCSAIFLVIVSPGFAVVRKVKSDKSQQVMQVGDSEESAPQIAVHCVVWVDGVLEGSRFKGREEADEFFKQLQHTELAAVQYDNLHEVQRFKSKRLKSVNWAKTKEWCTRNRDAPHALLQGPAPQAPMEPHASPIPKAMAPSLDTKTSISKPMATSLDAKASTMTGNVNRLEKQFSLLGSKASTLLKSIGVADTHASPALHFEVGASSAGLMVRSRGKLKTRIDAVEALGASVEEKVNRLETDFFGNSTAEKALASKRGNASSLTGRIKALAAQGDELGNRLTGLTSSTLLRDISKLEEQIVALVPKAADIFQSIGVDGADVAQKADVFATRKGGNLTDRLVTLESYTEEIQRGAALLEYELLGNAQNASTFGSPKAYCIEEHAVSLGNKLGHLQNHMVAVKAAMKDVDQLEGALAALFSRAATLSKTTGVAAALPQDASVALAHKNSALKPRMAALAEYASKMQDTTTALEEQLAGSISALPPQLKKNSEKGQIQIVKLQAKNMDARLSALEQQV
jgi:hypothetical protein